MPPGAIRTHDLSRRAAVDLRLRPRGHWDRPLIIIVELLFTGYVNFFKHYFEEYKIHGKTRLGNAVGQH
jgi:hypothetical protein